MSSSSPSPSIIMFKIEKSKNGYREGISRCLSQTLVYGIERRKTQLQIFGYTNKLSCASWTCGYLTSGCTAGIVYTTYFTIYNNLMNSQNSLLATFATVIAGIITSFIKIPIGNSMRILQSGKVNNILSAGKILYKEKGFLNLYKGYRISLIEDIIEMDIRLRLYNYISNKLDKKDNILLQTMIGSISGSFASGITTPFDTIRSRMIYNKPLSIMGLYNGVQYRTLSNAVKGATFFLFYEIL